jgi:2-polyprenyl-3-methyl-5-hydroxy-6-metoxy-1,4-benzoquinol methylase
MSYEFTFAWDSPYGHLVRLSESLGVEPGLVLDVGCGSAPLAEPFIERGFSYIGVDIDAESTDRLRSRGLVVGNFDLTNHAGIPDYLIDQAAGRRVSAILLTDVLEHVPEPIKLVRALAEAVQRLSFPTLLLSVPNVAHADLAAKLLSGRWDVRPTGLLDHTHVNFFTETRLRSVLASEGFHEIGRNDFALYRSDQAFPADLASIEPTTPLGGYLRSLRAQADDHGTVNQFVRAFALAPTARPAVATDGSNHDVDQLQPFASVIMRTQSERPTLLRDALTSLAAQSDSDFEVRLMVHSTHRDSVDKTQELVNGFDESFAGRVHVHQVIGGGRTRPLNEGLRLARGHYAAFLDDDDLVFGDWIEAFRSGAVAAPGAIVRAMTADQEFSSRAQSPGFAPNSGFSVDRPAEFDLLVHFHHNETPICSFAVPLATLREFRITFDERLPVVEDWDLLLRTATLTGVHDVGKVTSLYRRWDANGSSHLHAQHTWTTARDMVLEKLNGGPILLPARTVRRLADLDIRHREAIEPAEVRRMEIALNELANQNNEMTSQLGDARRQIATYEQSEWWKITWPLRKLMIALGRGRR